MAKTNWDEFEPIDNDGKPAPKAAPVQTDWSQFEPVAERGVIRSMADTGVAAGRGVATGVKMVADAFGANNTVSKAAGKAADAIGNLNSDYAKDLERTAAQRMQEAEATGSKLEEFKAGVQNFAERPIDATVEGLGSSLPTIAAMALTRGRVNPGAAAAGAGAVQGAGAVKGQIYDDVKQRHEETGAAPEFAEQQAQQAQAYRGPNTDQIGLGAGLGAVAGSTGVEAGVSRILAGTGKGGFIKSMASGIAKEAPMEFAQGGQERLASNIASQREGFDAPTWQGVVGQGTAEGLAGAGSGAAIGAVEGLGARRAAAEKILADPNAGVLTKAAATGELTGANAQKQAEAAAQAALEFEKIAPKGKEGLTLAPDVQTDPNAIDFETDDIRAERMAAGLENLRLYGSSENHVLEQDLPLLQEQVAELKASGTDYSIIPHNAGGYTIAPTDKLTPWVLERIAPLQPQPAVDPGAVPRLPGPDSALPNGRMIADADGGAAPETYGEAQRATAAATKQTELGKATPKGVNPSPNVRKPLLPLANEKVAQTLANSRTEKTGEQHTVIPHPTAKGKFAVVPVSDPSIVEAPARTIQSERDKRATPKAKEVLLLAHEAATSPKNDLPEPSQAQKDAGNYKKGHVNLHGLDISIENPQGSTRSGIDPNGKQWSNILANHYGYIKGTTGADGDHVDTFIGNNPDSDKVFVVDQVEPTTGKFDESKVMLGFDSAKAAKDAYQANYAPGWKGAKDVTETSVAGFKAWLSEGDTAKPFAPQAKVDPYPIPPNEDRRQDAATRKTVNDMSPDEMRRALLVDDMTGLGNKRAYNEVDKKPYQASIDIDSLKWVNDNMGHASGDKLIELIGQALKDEGVDAYHISGDEFVAQFDGEQEGDSALQRVRDRLKGAVIEFTAQDGTVTIKNGVEFSYGIANTIDAADERLGQDKARREASGERAGRGQEPAGVAKRPAQGRNNHPGDTAAEEEVKPAKPDLPGLAKLKAAKAKKNAEKVAAVSPGLKKLQDAKAKKAAAATDAANQFIPSPDGGIDFGEITAEQAAAMKRQAGKIRLQQGIQHKDGTGYGLAHIEANHGKQIRNAGFDSVEKFVADAVKGMDQIWQPGKTSQVIAVVSGKKGRAVYLELTPGSDASGDYYRVNSAFPVSNIYVARKEKKEGWKPLWSRDPVPADASGASGFVDQSPNAGETAPMVSSQSGESSIADSATEATAPIGDFGEKISGAKKELWSGYRHRMAEELPQDAKDITLSKHFPEPDYEAMIADGADVRVLAAIKAMRDEIPAKPRVSFKVRRWGDQVKFLRGFANSLINGEIDIDRAMRQMRSAEYRLIKFADRIEMYAALGYPAFKHAGDFSIEPGNYSILNGVEYKPPVNKWALQEKGRTAGYFDSMVDAVESLRAKLQTKPEGNERSVKLDLYRVTKTGEIVIGKKIGTGKYIDLKDGFKDVREARAYLLANEAELLALLEKKKEIRPERRSTNDPRQGKDYREGENIAPEKFAATFGFRGVQFGNYVEQARRIKDLNNAYDALLDLAGLINIPERAVSLNGTLGLAFGARGSGGKGAFAAHYEQKQVVINLTKTNGAGTLAHEWWHALDNHLGKRRGDPDGFVTDNPKVRKKYGPNRSVIDDDSIRPEVLEAYAGVVKAINDSGMRARSQAIDARRSKDYWSTPVELTARAFESYIIDKAAERKESNDYLANIIGEDAHKMMDEAFGTKEPFPYPIQSEKAAINAAFDKLFQTLQSKETDNGVMLFNAGDRNLTGSGIDGKLLSQVIQGASTTDILKTIAQDSANPQFREMAQALIAHGVNSTVEIGSAEGPRFKVKSIENTVYVAAYSPKRDAVMLFGATRLDQHLIHEFTHAATYKALRKNGLAAGQMKSLYNHVQKSGQLAGEYGMENVDEFVAEAFSNPDFQDKLRAITKMPAGSKFRNAWDSFVALVRRVLGLPESMETALDQVLRTGRALMAENKSATSGTKSELLGNISSNVPTDAFKELVLSKTYGGKGTEPAPEGSKYLAAIQRKTNRGIFVVDGNLDRATLKAMIAEVNAAGLDHKKLYVFADTATYTGPGIEVMKLEDMPGGRPGSFNPDDDSILGSIGGTFAGATETLRSGKTLESFTGNVKDLLKSDRKFGLWDRTIGTQFNKATKDSDFRRVFDALNQQTDDTAHFAIEAERVAPSVLHRLDSVKDIFTALGQGGNRHKKDLEAVSKALFANIEGEKGVQQKIFSDAELAKDFGLNGKQIEMYRQVRLSVDTSIDRLAQTTIASMGQAVGMDIAGLKNLSLEETAKAVKEGTEDGAIGRNILGMKPTKHAELHQRIDDLLFHANSLKAAGYMPAMRFGQYAVTVTDPGTGAVEYFSMFESQFAANVALKQAEKQYPGMLAEKSVMNPDQFAMFKGVSPETVELFAKFSGMDQNEAFQDYIALAKSGRSAMKRMLERKGVAGFSDDVGRVLASFITSNARQSALNMNGSEVTAALAAVPTRKGDVQQQAQKLVDYMQNPREEAQALRGFLFMNFIGGSIASAAVNLTQPVLQTTPYLTQYAGAKTVSIMAASAKMAATGKVGNPELRAALERAAADGITEPHEIHHLMADASGSTLGTGLRARALTKAWGGFFAAAEAYNRRLTFIAAYQTAMNMGQKALEAKGFKDAYAFAARAIIETQGLYSKANRPNWARGSVGATLFTFKQFSISYIEFLNRLPMQQKAIALGILVLVAGLQGLPFAEDIEDLIDSVGQSMGYNTNSQQALRETAVRLFGATLGAIVTHGISTQMGIDMQGRLGMGNLVPGSSLFKPSETDKGRDALQLAGPIGSVIASFQKAIIKAQTGEITGKTGALAELAPVAIKNMLQGGEMAQTGVYKDTKGRKVTDVGPADALGKFFGFQPANVAADARKMNDANQNVQLVRAVESAIAGQWAQGIADKDLEQVRQAMAKLRKWNEQNPDSKIAITPAQIKRRVEQMQMTREQRFIKTVPKEMRAQTAKALNE